MRFPGYDPVPDPDDDRELSPLLRRLDQTLNPIALALCFGHVASVWYREVSFSEVIYDLKFLFKALLNAAYNGPTDAARLKQPKLSESFISLSKYSGTPHLKGFKGIGETYIREAYTGFRQVSLEMGVKAPMPISVKFEDFNNTFHRIVTVAEHPHLSIPETELGKARKQFHRLIDRSHVFVSVVLAVALAVGSVLQRKIASG